MLGKDALTGDMAALGAHWDIQIEYLKLVRFVPLFPPHQRLPRPLHSRVRTRSCTGWVYLSRRPPKAAAGAATALHAPGRQLPHELHAPGSSRTYLKSPLAGPESARGCGAARQARHYEQEFYEDMGALGVGLPDMLTRVSEYVPQVIAYVAKIVEQARRTAVHSALVLGGPHPCTATRRGTACAAALVGAMWRLQPDATLTGRGTPMRPTARSTSTWQRSLRLVRGQTSRVLGPLRRASSACLRSSLMYPAPARSPRTRGPPAATVSDPSGSRVRCRHVHASTAGQQPARPRLAAVKNLG